MVHNKMDMHVLRQILTSGPIFLQFSWNLKEIFALFIDIFGKTYTILTNLEHFYIYIFFSNERSQKFQETFW